MPWYHYTANHGGGHQSHTDEYIFHDDEISPEAQEDYWQDWAHAKHIDYGRGSVTRVEGLPPKVQQSLIATWTAKRDHANRVLQHIAEFSLAEEPQPCLSQ